MPDTFDLLSDTPANFQADPLLGQSGSFQAQPNFSAVPRPQQPAVQPAAPAQPNFRPFLDPDATRKLIYDRTLAALKDVKPISNQKYTLSLVNPKYVDPDVITKRKQKQAILEGGTLARRIQGTWQVTDNETGQVVNTKKSILARVPHYTSDGMFILNGNKTSLASQMRLRSGVYTRRKENGELESHINVVPGKGLSHRVTFDPESQLFKLQVSQSELPLLPILKALGVKESTLREQWGELYNANNLKADTTAVKKFLGKVTRSNPGGTDDEHKLSLKEALEKMPLDPEVTQSTLGNAYDKITPDVYLAATKKLLGLSRGEIEPDDRDHLGYMTIHGPEDLLSERIGKDQTALRKALWKLTMKKGDLTGFGAGIFTKPLQAAIMGSGLGQPLEEINPLQSLEQQGRVSRMGVGGLPGSDQVPQESRSVQPSHYGYIDPIATPENMRAGVDSRVSNSARKGEDGKIYSQFRNLKTGQMEYLSPDKFHGKTIAFPNEDPDFPAVRAMRNGAMGYFKRDEIDYDVPEFENAFGPLSNLIPMKSGIKGQRLAMGGRMSSQALPLVNPEAPLVQSGVPDGDENESYEDRYGTYGGAVRSKTGGYVKSLDDDTITIEQPDGKLETHELSVHVASNRKTGFNQTPLVRIGQYVAPNQLVARSNYTDDKGTLALGRNLRVALVPGFGDNANYEDAFVISRSAAKKLVSDHYYQHSVDNDAGVKFSKKDFVAAFPGKYERKVLDNFDDKGLIKPGTVVQPGDPLILALRKKEPHRAQLFRSKGPSYSDAAETWDHHHEGVVTDVAMGKYGPKVVVHSLADMEVADKIAGRYGNKGVVSSIVDDKEMPHDQDGNPYEILFNPAGVITRGNPSAALEIALGKIAAKTGKPYKVKDFKDIKNLAQFVVDELDKHKVSDTETIIDPRSGRRIPNILTGNAYFMKLHHTVASKNSGRGVGGYSAEGQPVKGGPEGAKRVALMSTNALLSHGATSVLNDAITVRGQANPNYWLAFMSGHTPPTPQVPLVHQKFVKQLQGAGINIVREGTKFRAYALLNKDIDKLTEGRILRNAESVDWKEGLKPIKGGLFDESLTHGHGGKAWTAMQLHEPMPSPVMEEPIRRLLGLTQKQYRDVLSGNEKYRELSGPKAIANALNTMNLDSEIAKARLEIKSGKKTLRDAANRRLAYLKSAKENDAHPRDWVWDKVPVLPPMFRPVSVMSGNNKPMTADANVLYKELWDANENLKEMAGRVGNSGDERLAVYDAIKAVTGLDDPIQPKTREQGVKGILKEVFGDSPKYGAVQRKLLAAPVDIVGRSVIIPNPDLDLDSIGIPENRAWDIYRPFIVRKLVRRGLPMAKANQEVKDHSKLAREAMEATMKERPVILDRAPVLHRYGVMAFWPKLVKGDAIQVTPLTCSGFGSDFDGDQQNFQVPVSSKAVEEAIEKLMPSKNLISPSNFKVHQLPNREFATGLYYGTKSANKLKTPVTFRSKADAIRAYERGELDVDDPIEIVNH